MGRYVGMILCMWAVLAGLQGQAEPDGLPTITVRKLNQDELGEVLQALKARYPDSASVTENELNAAALQGIVNRLGPGVQILEKAPDKTAPVRPPAPARTEMLPGDILYFFVPEITPHSVALVSEALRKAPVTLQGVVLDLRFSQGDDFKSAAEMASLWLGPSRPLYQLQGNKGQPPVIFQTRAAGGTNLDTPLILVVNGQTAGAAEALAGSLRDQSRGLAVGMKTSGQAARYTDVPLSSGRWLRMAVQQVVLQKGTPLFGSGLVPDIVVEAKPEKQREWLQKAAAANTAGLVIDLDTRKRLTEADLVRKTDPEIDKAVERSKKDERQQAPPPVRDLMVQRAVDLIKGINVLSIGR